jgi:hypothetical protein
MQKKKAVEFTKTTWEKHVRNGKKSETCIGGLNTAQLEPLKIKIWSWTIPSIGESAWCMTDSVKSTVLS